MGYTFYGVTKTRASLKRRGLVFLERFESAAEVEKNGGTVYGTPTFERGITLNGTTDYIQYRARINPNNGLNIIMEFTPDFAKNDNVLRFFFDSDTSNRYNFYKDTVNDFNIFIGNTNFVITYATYATHWKDFAKNVITMSVSGSTIIVFLNGVQVLNASSAAWDKKGFLDFVIGARTASYALKFIGTFHNFRFFTSYLTDQENLAYYDGSMWDYMRPENCVLHMDGRAKHHEPTNNRVLDMSGNGNHVDKGDGAGTGEPTKYHKLGYTFDGVNDYIQLPDRTAKFPYMYLQIAGVNQLSTSTAVYDSILTSGGFTGIVYAIGLFSTDLNATQIIDFQFFINPNEVGS